MNLSPDNLRWFRHCASYINTHRGKVMVLMISSEAIDDGHFTDIAQDIALLHSLGVKLVLCFGARQRIDARLASAGIESRFHQGRRICDADTMGPVIEVIGSLRSELESLFASGIAANPTGRSHISVCSGNFLRAQPLGVLDGVDHQQTGTPRSVDTATLTQLLDNGHLVLLPPLGYSATGEVFNLLAEEVAASVAISLQADKLIQFLPRPGLLDDNGDIIRQCELADAEQLLANLADPEAHRALAALIAAAKQGVARCHCISFRENGALLEELFTRDGCGTLLAAKTYESVETAGAADVGALMDIIAPLQEQGILRQRSRESILADIDKFRVLKRDGLVIACAALHQWPQQQAAEIACIATHADYRGADRAERLLTYVEREARLAGVTKLFALTTRTSHWFQERGFETTGTDSLPPPMAGHFSEERNSLVLVKQLAEAPRAAGLA